MQQTQNCRSQNHARNQRQPNHDGAEQAEGGEESHLGLVDNHESGDVRYGGSE